MVPCSYTTAESLNVDLLGDYKSQPHVKRHKLLVTVLSWIAFMLPNVGIICLVLNRGKIITCRLDNGVKISLFCWIAAMGKKVAECGSEKSLKAMFHILRVEDCPLSLDIFSHPYGCCTSQK